MAITFQLSVAEAAAKQTNNKQQQQITSSQSPLPRALLSTLYFP